MKATRQDAATDRTRLRLLATSDLHAHLLAWDYYTECPAPDRGLARIASLVARMRRGAEVTLLLDNGDFLQGSPLGDAVAEGAALLPGGLHPVIAAMNAMGYDAAALGNHEFSHGMALLERVLDQAKFPILSANLLTERAELPILDKTFLPATALIRRKALGQPLTIGVIGLTPPRTLLWEASQIDRPIEARDMAETAEDHAAALRSAGADVVVVLCHSGLGSASDESCHDTEAAEVARLPGIDAVIAGHTHGLFPDPRLAARPGIDHIRGRVGRTPAVAPGFFGSHLGVIDLMLQRQAGGWRIGGRQARLAAVAGRDPQGRLTSLVPEDPDLRALTLPAHEATRRWAAQTIGTCTVRTSTHFSLVAPSEPVRLVARAKAEALVEALAGTPHAGLPILSAAAPFRAGGRGGTDNYTILPRGSVSLRHLADLYPFPNTLVGLRTNGAGIATWLERSAALFAQILPGSRDTELFDPAFPSFNFDMIEGITYRIDLSRPAIFDAQGRFLGIPGGRVTDLRLDGQPLDPARPVILATNNYRVSDQHGFLEGIEAEPVYQGDLSCREALRGHIARLGRIPPPQPPNWGFRPMPGTTVLIDSAPAAVEFLDQLPGFEAEPLEMTEEGFRRFRLHLD